MIVVWILGIVCLAGLLLTTGTVVLVWRFFRRTKHPDKQLLDSTAHRTDHVSTGLSRLEDSPDSKHRRLTAPDSKAPLVSILKPLCGLEDELEQNLSSFAKLTGPPYEVILSVADPRDPAIAIVERVRERFPNAPFRLLVGGITPGLSANLKVERLIAAGRIARADVLFISDANIRVSPEVIEQAVVLLRDPAVGCVSNPFLGAGAQSLGSIIESLYLLVYAVPGCVLASAVGATCLVGKSVAIRREVLDKIGGFEVFSNYLAEDQAMGVAIRAAGYRLILAPQIVQNVTVNHLLSTALARQVRWGKIRYAFSKLGYTAEFAANPFPIALIGCAAASGLLPTGTLLGVVLIVILIRILQAAALSAATRADIGTAQLLLVPIQDVLQFGAQFLPFFSNEVRWRNLRAKLGRETVMLFSHRDKLSEASAASIEEKSASSIQSFN